jgi:[protein-PII] uridylyltransferase
VTAEQLEQALRDAGEAGTPARRQFRESRMAQLRQAHSEGAPGLQTARGIADLTDTIVLDAWSAATAAEPPGKVALLAMGGYGRRRMAPMSDVDLLILFARTSGKEEELVRGVLHPLWDVGFDIGHASRTVSECVKQAKQDLQSLTAMLDARFLAGDEGLAEELRQRLLKQLPKTAATRLHKLHLGRGDHLGSVQLLEPNVKESPGGLREIHLWEWGLKCRLGVTDTDNTYGDYLDDEDLYALRDGREFLWRVRHELHFVTGRKHDVLENENKPAVASTLGYSDRIHGAGPVDSGVNSGLNSGAGGAPPAERVGPTDRTGADRGLELAVESFLRDYYLHAQGIFHAVRLGFGNLMAKPKKGRRLVLEPGVVAIDNEIEIPGKARWLQEEPLRLLRVFAHCQSRHMRLSEPAARLVRHGTAWIDDRVRHSPEARDLFLRILKRKQRAADTLRAMHELGILGAYLPEFGETTCLVQYDIYHVYTVDEHTLVGLERLEELTGRDAGHTLRVLYEELERKDLLFLGLLLHDVGKARRTEHISEGIEMGRTLCERIGLSDADTRCVLFLIENHQEMVMISQRRSLDDTKLIADFAGRFANVEWLKMLYLLSYADLSSVAADAWSQWHGALLWELYHKTKEQLESGLKALEDRQSARQVAEAHLTKMKGVWSPQQIAAFEEHTRQLPPSYLQTFSLAQVERHIRLTSRLQLDGEGAGDVAAATVEVEFVEHEDRTEVVVATRDRRHLLATICGVLAVNDIDILHADVQTRDDDVVIDTFQVTDTDGAPVLPEWKRERLVEALTDVIEGRVDVQQLFDNYSARRSNRASQPLRQPEVQFENQVSDRYTVVDVNARDAVGLLYTLTHSLGEIGLDIHMAIVNTVADRATDAFYVVDEEGRKIVNYDRLDEIRDRLLERLQPAD